MDLQVDEEAYTDTGAERGSSFVCRTCFEENYGNDADAYAYTTSLHSESNLRIHNPTISSCILA
jgi:hypothetical protein